MDVLQQRRARLRSKSEQLRHNPALARLRHELQRTGSSGGLWFAASPPRVDPAALADQVGALTGGTRRVQQCLNGASNRAPA